MADQVEQLTQEEIEKIFSHSDSFIANYDDEVRGKLEAIHRYSILMQAMNDEKTKGDATNMLKHFLIPPAYLNVVTEDQLKAIASSRVEKYTVDVKPHIRTMFPELINECNDNLEELLSKAHQEMNKGVEGLNEVYLPEERNLQHVKPLYDRVMLSPQLVKGEEITRKLLERKQSLKSLQDEELDLIVDLYGLASLKERSNDQEQTLRAGLIKFHENKGKERLAALEEGSLEYEKAKEDLEVIKYLINAAQGDEANKLYEVARKTIYLEVLKKTDNTGTKYNGKAIYDTVTSAFEALTVEDTKGEQVPDYKAMIPATVELAVHNTQQKNLLERSKEAMKAQRKTARAA